MAVRNHVKDCEIEDLVANSVWEGESSYDTTEDEFVCCEIVATIGVCVCIETDEFSGSNGNGPCAKQRTPNPHGNTSAFKWVTGPFTPVIHIYDIGCTGVNEK
jgi:hypothetical protein